MKCSYFDLHSLYAPIQFRGIDTDGSGFISIQELKQLVKNLLSQEQQSEHDDGLAKLKEDAERLAKQASSQCESTDGGHDDGLAKLKEDAERLAKQASSQCESTDGEKYQSLRNLAPRSLFCLSLRNPLRRAAIVIAGSW